MTPRIASTLVAAAALAATAAAAPTAQVGDLTLRSMEVRASLGRNPNSGGYLVIDNAGAADALVGASCACARAVELHVMSHEGGVMRMGEVEALAIPAGGRLALKPGGAHLMILGLKQPLKAGSDVRMTLRFRRAGEVTARFRVTATPAAGVDAHAGH